MRSIIEFRDGRSLIIEDVAPLVDVDAGHVVFIDNQRGVVTDNVRLEEINRIVFVVLEQPLTANIRIEGCKILNPQKATAIQLGSP